MYKKNGVLIHVFIISITLLVFANSIQNNFVIDDWSFIVGNDFIKNWRNIYTFFTAEYLKLSPSEIDLQRPLSSISLMIDYQLWGLDPKGYHLTNVIIHACNVIVVFHFLKYFASDNSIPIIGALVFAVHPVQTEAVNAINFREELLVTFFYLLSLILFMRGVRSPFKKSLLSASIVAYSLALLSKEMALTLPIAVLFTHLSLEKKIDHILKEKWFYFCLSIITVIYLLGLIFLNYPLNKSFPGRVDLIRYHLNLPIIIGILAYYLKLYLLPLNLSLEHEFSRYSTILEPKIAVLGLLITFFIFIGLILLKKNSTYGLFVLWFFITIVPVSNLAPLNDPVAERYLYLPSIGPITMLAILIDSACNRNKNYMFLLLIVLIAAFAVLTVQRNEAWKNDYTLWKDAVKKDPMNPLTHQSFAMATFSKGNMDEALVELKKAERLKPNAVTLSDIYYNIGLVYKAKIMYDKALDALDSATKLNPYNADAYIAMGKVFRKVGNTAEANGAFQKALMIDPSNKKVLREIRLFVTN